MKRLNAIALMVGLLALTQLAKAEEVNLNLGYNALETGITDKDGVRNRLLTNVDAALGDTFLGYSGLNEIENGDRNTYFGKHVVTAGEKEAGTKAAFVAFADRKGFIDKKFGIRNTSIPEMLGYGSIDAVANRRAANITVLQGIPLGDHSLELYLQNEIPFNRDNPFVYGEVQLNIGLAGYASAFARAELAGIGQPDMEVGGLVGITLSK